MTAFAFPASLVASAADPQPSEVRAYMEPLPDASTYKWGQRREFWTAHACRVVKAAPLTVSFEKPMPVAAFWTDEHGEPFDGDTVPSGTPVRLGRLAHRVACLYDEVDEWLYQRRQREAAGTDAMHLRLNAEKARDGVDCTPYSDPRIEVDAAGFLALVRDYEDACAELEVLRADACRAQEIIEAEEAAAVRQAERDGLGVAS